VSLDDDITVPNEDRDEVVVRDLVRGGSGTDSDPYRVDPDDIERRVSTSASIREAAAAVRFPPGVVELSSQLDLRDRNNLLVVGGPTVVRTPSGFPDSFAFRVGADSNFLSSGVVVSRFLFDHNPASGVGSLRIDKVRNTGGVSNVISRGLDSEAGLLSVACHGTSYRKITTACVDGSTGPHIVRDGGNEQTWDTIKAITRGADAFASGPAVLIKADRHPDEPSDSVLQNCAIGSYDTGMRIKASVLDTYVNPTLENLTDGLHFGSADDVQQNTVVSLADKNCTTTVRVGAANNMQFIGCKGPAVFEADSEQIHAHASFLPNLTDNGTDNFANRMLYDGGGKFVIHEDGGRVASFDDAGNLTLSGTLTEGGSP
jgi:hypothetical protein